MATFADIEAVLFDLGGTLVDYPVPSWPVLAGRCVRGVFSGMVVGAEGRLPPATEVPGPDEAQSRRRAPRPDTPVVHRIMAALRRVVRSVSGRTLPNMGEMCFRPLMARGRLYDDALPALRALRGRGYRLALVSNTPWGTPDYLWGSQLERFDLAPLFEVACFSSEVGFRKPDPRIFHAALDRLGVGPERAFFVGDDTGADIVGAAGLGMRCALIRRPGREPAAGPAAPDLSITSLAELLDALPGRGQKS